jgi:cytochrome c nitrite reductase small subunit
MSLRSVQFIALGITVGVAIGVCVYTFAYARGWSYLTDNPQACVNCHVMNQQYDAWIKASHRSAAVCNDCHTPPGLFRKYAVKARNGFWHSFYFTTGWFDDNIQITAAGRGVVEEACRNCHQEIVTAIEGVHAEARGRKLVCVRCHDSVGHMR